MAHSPSRHIHTALTMGIGFAGCEAFEWLRQRLIKVDGTFA
ncbi:MAG: hypothetical protein OJF48_005071 [Afipia sp.]|nr:MAG: hypothetical protein OJF48_005071 [Afipia sp.]